MIKTIDLASHLDALSRYAFVLTRDPDQADDLVQEVLIRALEGAHTWQPDRGLRPWLFAIVHNLYISRRRRQIVENNAALQLTATASDAVPADQLDRVELNQTVRALMRLPEDQREVLVLVAVEGLSYKDAATILRIPLGTLMSRLGRARQALRLAAEHENPSASSSLKNLRVVR